MSEGGEGGQMVHWAWTGSTAEAFTTGQWVWFHGEYLKFIILRIEPLKLPESPLITIIPSVSSWLLAGIVGEKQFGNICANNFSVFFSSHWAHTTAHKFLD